MSKEFAREKIENNYILRLGETPKLPEHKTAVELDELDRAIIESQQEDPFFSYNEMAEKWNVTPATIRNRIKTLKAEGVIDVVTLINPYKIGFETFATIGVKLKARAKPDEFVEAISAMDGISGLTMVAGSFDFFITCVCRNMDEYRWSIVEQLRSIPEIESFESFIGLELYERNFLVGLVNRGSHG
jgi:Lrp/AsnC family transcriptional regulator, regulator for asnA, asnC and gidA